jgi:predicted nucleic acid-binding protein
MITAVDTNILLDVLIPGQRFGEASKKLLDHHLSNGQLILCEVVYAELAAHFPSEKGLRQFMADTGIALVHANEKSLYAAGEGWAAYSKKGNRNKFTCRECGRSFAVTCPQCKTPLARRLHVLADFIVGAHALLQADCILSRDLGIYGTYFSKLKVVGSP